MVHGDFLGAFGLLENDDGVLLVANPRVIAGRERIVWDLPGGQVEPGETLHEGLAREMKEETGLEVAIGDFFLVAEGERLERGERTAVWRSFFFRIERTGGSLDHSAESDIVDARFFPRSELPGLLDAPYHRGFVAWLASDGRCRLTFDRWAD